MVEGTETSLARDRSNLLDVDVQQREQCMAVRTKRRRQSRMMTLLHQLLLTAIVIALLAPIYMAVVTSLHPAGGFTLGTMGLPNAPTLSNYGIAWNDLNFRGMLYNSVVLTAGAAVISTLIAAAGAYSLARFRPLGGAVLRGSLVALMAVPPIITIIPVFLIAVSWGQFNTRLSGIVAEVGLLVPFSTLLFYSYMLDFDDSYFEAAELDGAGSVRQFMYVALPLSRPALVANFVLAAVFVWNDLLVPLILWQGAERQTLMVGLASLGPGRTGVRDVPLLMAGVVLTILPLVALFALTLRTLVRGLTEGSGK